uniref:Alpha/beta hydrolase fold-3 domain-containing protein n=1 Tax=Anas platyrhynchos platyrhynchos TaxID=8840 RepID=A0A493TXQ9_ANAPP
VVGGWYEAVGLGDTEKGTPRLLPHSLLPDRAWGQRVGLPAQARGAKATPLPQARSLAGDRHGSIFSRDRLSAEDPAGAAAKGEGSGERLRRRLNPATTKPGCPRSGRGKGLILEKLGVCTKIAFTRYMRSGRKLGPDPQLSLVDARFGRVPVRLYRPRAPSAGLRPGAIFFHGGGWLYCSIGRAPRGVGGPQRSPELPPPAS